MLKLLLHLKSFLYETISNNDLFFICKLPLYEEYIFYSQRFEFSLFNKIEKKHAYKQF